MGFNDRLQHAWDAFMNKDPTATNYNSGNSSTWRPDRIRLSRGNERSIVTSVYNRIAIDAAAIKVEHVRLDSEDRYIETMSTCLNECLTTEANLDQTGRALIQDAVMSILDEGCIAIVPVATDIDPTQTEAYKIEELRVGKIVEWKPAFVKVRLYNERLGRQEDIWISKNIAAIIENPWYSVMNEPNSTSQRLIRKLNLLDAIDEQSGSGKLDLIIQLPYIIKTEGRRIQAEERKRQIEEQLKGPYGIAYTDATERITQLNRPVENNLMKQIEYLTTMLYSQLGLTASIMDGSADDKTMNNYYNRTIEPILSAIVDEMKRKFLTKTARSQKQTIRFFRDPFKLVPVSELPDIADKFTRNEIVTSNEMRQVIGMKPSTDPNADQLRNKNLNQSNQSTPIQSGGNQTEPNVNSIDSNTGSTDQTQEEPPMTQEEYDQSIKDLDDLDDQLNELDDEMMHYNSPYYDPVKAHEYYERTKELKNRKSTAKLNDAGKQAARYVKEQINAEKKQVTETERQSIKDKINSHKEQMQNEINSLRERLKGMSKQEREENRESIRAEISGLRDSNKAIREQLRETFKQTKSNLKTQYDEKYISEIDKIRSTSAFTKKANASKKKQSGIIYTKDLKGGKS